MTRSRLLLPLSLTLVFASGAVVGALADRYHSLRSVSAGAPSQPPRKDGRGDYLQRMRTRLDLSADQARQLQTIMGETDIRFRQHREQGEAEGRRIRESHAQQVRQILRPEQQAEYEKMRSEWRQERQRREAEKKARHG